MGERIRLQWAMAGTQQFYDRGGEGSHVPGESTSSATSIAHDWEEIIPMILRHPE
jgi:hypothetical protein